MDPTSRNNNNPKKKRKKGNEQKLRKISVPPVGARFMRCFSGSRFNRGKREVVHPRRNLRRCQYPEQERTAAGSLEKKENKRLRARHHFGRTQMLPLSNTQINRFHLAAQRTLSLHTKAATSMSRDARTRTLLFYAQELRTLRREAAWDCT